MSVETISMVARVILSLLFSYVPGMSGWYAELGENKDGSDDGGTLKRLVMLALLVAVAGGAFGLICLSWGSSLGISITCDQQGAIGLLRSLILAVMANQATYKITKRRDFSLTPAPLPLGEGNMIRRKEK